MDYQELLKQTAIADDRIVVMTAENRALVRQLPPIIGNRFIDTGITEQTMIGMAAGLALRGRIPVCHALTTFLTLRAFEFIRTDVGIPGLPVKLSGFIPGFLSDANGPTHQAIEDVGLMRGIPHMEVFCPGDEDDMVKMLPYIWNSDKPSYLRVNTHKTNYIHSEFLPGKAEIIVAPGTEVTILVYGYLFKQALEAQSILQSSGYSTGLINMRSLKPIDESAVVQAAATSAMIVTLEDHLQHGGLYSAVCETLIKNGTMCKVLPLSLNDRWFKPALLDDVLQYEGFTAPQIAAKIISQLN